MYLHFFQGILEKLQPLSLEFQKEELLVCQVPRKNEETKALVDVLYDVPGEAYSRLLQGLKDDVNDRYLVYQDTVPKKSTGRRAPDTDNTSEGFQEHFSHKFQKIVKAVQNYLDNCFVDFNKTPLSEMVKIFNTKMLPSSFHRSKLKRTWGNHEIPSMAKYDEKYGFFTSEEKEMTVKQWTLFCQKVIQLKHPTKSHLEIYVDILASADGIKGMSLLLKKMKTISASTASCERKFSSMNNEKTYLRTHLTNETLDDILKIKINGTDFKNFDAKPHVQSWLDTNSTRHIRGHSKPKRKAENEDSNAKN